MTQAVLPTYNRTAFSIESGEGAWVKASDGRTLLDFGAGIAVNSLGHCHPHLVETLKKQAETLWHTSNLYRIPEGERLAERLCEATFADTVFFTNSGAEAIECSIKMARKYHAASGHPEKFRLITFEGAFHGRTLATIAAGGQQHTETGLALPLRALIRCRLPMRFRPLPTHPNCLLCGFDRFPPTNSHPFQFGSRPCLIIQEVPAYIMSA